MKSPPRTSRLVKCIRRAGPLQVGALMLMSGCAVASPVTDTADSSSQDEFLSIYRELVEIDTSLPTGSCTKAADRMADRLRDAGYSDANVQVIIPEAFPEQGNLVVEVPGIDQSLLPVLFLAHIDVVAVDRAEWKRDPFKLIEEDDYFYARGTVDDKAMAASYIDTLVQFSQEGFQPRRTLKFALTCGEETDTVFNGVEYLLEEYPDTLSAGFAINEGGKGLLREDGEYMSLGIEAGQKIYQDFTLSTSAPGGHSARPVPGNAIGRMSRALARIDAYTFPVDLIDTSRVFFERSAELYEGTIHLDMIEIGAGQATPDAYSRISEAVPIWNAMLRTTCIPTLVEGGHAENAQPRSATANVNCRILPGQSVEQVQARLHEVVADEGVLIEISDEIGPVSPPPPLTKEVLGPIEQAASAVWPDVPIIPSLSTGATDGRFLNAAGIPTYGASGMFVDPDGNGVHGLDERIRVRSLLEGRAFLYNLIKAYAAK